MSDELGPGDVVEAKTDIGPDARVGMPFVARGTRTIVQEITEPGRCSQVDCALGARSRGLVLKDFPLPPHVAWCPCMWKKIGGSKDETVARFAGYLNDLRLPELLPTTPPPRRVHT